MKAIEIAVAGGPEVLTLVEKPVPQPKPGEVLVRAHVIGVGWPDVLFRKGVYRWRPPLPATPGAEMTGTVEAVGAGVEGFRVGDKALVYHFRGGCYAEYVACEAASVAKLPDNIDLDAAIALPNYQIAWALLNEAARGIPMKAIYVNGAAGAVGTALVQIAASRGITVIGGVGSAAKAEFARSQGATHTIDYSHESVADRILALTDGRGADVIFDHVIGPNFTDMIKAVAILGLVVSFNMVGGWPEKDVFRELRANLPRSPAVRCFAMHSFDDDPEARKRIADETIRLLVSGAVKPVAGKRLPLAEARRAHELLDGRQVMGKLVLVP